MLLEASKGDLFASTTNPVDRRCDCGFFFACRLALNDCIVYTHAAVATKYTKF